MRDAPTVGTDAPDFILHAEGGRVLATLQAHRPRMLAFVRGWSVGRVPECEVHEMRDDLRYLGADMTIASESAAWTFRPDDDVELCTGGTAQLARELDAAARRWGVDRGRDAIFMIDPDGLIQFAHRADAPLASPIGAALATASAALHAKARPASFTRPEWTTTCLIAGLAVNVLSAA